MFGSKLSIWLRKVGFAKPLILLWGQGEFYERTWSPGYLVYRRAWGPVYYLAKRAPSRQVLREYKRKVVL
jgi:hypothetical protein